MADLEARLKARLQVAFDELEPGADPVVRPSERADFQANGVLALAKRLGRRPDELAREIVGKALLDDLCAQVEVSGPGFINLTLSDQVIEEGLDAMAGDRALGVEKRGDATRVVVDYSAPNVAKEMHVGHMRGTIIGDALCKMLELVGNDVVRENHIGDWGTPFGMLIEHLVDLGEDEAVHELSVGDLNTFYRHARTAFDNDESFAERSRRRVVLLQSGDAETLRLWRVLVDESVSYFEEVYAKLGVELSAANTVGESFYNPLLDKVVEELDKKGLLVESDGALCVFPPGFVNREGQPLPVIVRKSDGGFGYAATDLAAIYDRTGRLGARRLLYVVGAPQAQHFEMCFAVARLAGWLGEGAEAVHVSFGNVLDASGKMLKSRRGEAIRLIDLLDEAVERAERAVRERDPDLSADAAAKVAEKVGIGALKYADLSTERQRDYVFDWDRMLAFEGNTGPYLQYAYARICSIFRRAGLEDAPNGAKVRLLEPAERALGLRLVSYPEVVSTALSTYSPSRLTSYLYELATGFTTFYERCPVLRAPSEELRNSRLALASLTRSVLRAGLSLLGIATPEQM